MTAHNALADTAALITARAQIVAELLDDVAEALEHPSVTALERAGALNDTGQVDGARLARNLGDVSRRLAVSVAQLVEQVELQRAASL